jgi:hypothetical protein
MRPLLFLDVDGVLNCLFPIVEAEYVKTLDGSREVHSCVPKGTRDRLARVLEVYDPVWATAWMGGAHRHFRDHLGLSEIPWPYIDFFDFKLTQIIKYASKFGNFGTLRPWAWVDDDAKWEIKQLGEHFGQIPDTLIISPQGKIGITDEHVDQLLEFAARYDAADESAR